jgi:hypothetical protein
MSFNLKNSIGLLTILSLIIFSPLLVGYNFPLWSTDNLFGSYPTLEMSREIFLNEDTNWLPSTLLGIDFGSSVNNLTFSPIFSTFFLLLKTTKFIYIANSIGQFFAFMLVGLAMFGVSLHFLKSRGCALFVSIAYLLSTTTLYYLQTFPNIYLQMFFLLSLFSILKIDEYEKVKSIILITASISCLLLTGHPVYSAYFFIAIAIITLYIFFNEVKYKRKFCFILSICIFLILTIVSYRLLPFFIEVVNGSRIDTNYLFSGDPARLGQFLKIFIPEIDSISIDKTNNLANALRGNRTEISRLLGINNSQITFLYCGVCSPLILFLTYKKINKFWLITSGYFIGVLILPGIFGTLGNIIFFPFMHSAHLYLGTFFLLIATGFGLKELAALRSDENNCLIIKKVTNFVVILTIIFLGIIFLNLELLNKISINIFYHKFLFIAFLILMYLIYKNKNYFENIKIKYLFLICFIISLLLPEVSRNFSIYLIIDILFLYYIYKFVDLSKISINKIFLLVISFGIINLFGMLLLSDYKNHISLDYPYPGYFRLNNGYSKIKYWNYEYIYILLLSVFKFILISKIILIIIANRVNKNFLVSAFILITCIDQLNVFKNFSSYTSQPFIKINYSELFQKIDLSSIDSMSRFRFNNVHKLIPTSTIFDSSVEEEIYTNLPYAYGIKSYAGVNSQVPNKLNNFIIEWINGPKGDNEKLNLNIIPNSGLDPVGIAANYNDSRLLDLLGVRYDIKGQNNLYRSAPILIDSLNEINIIAYKDLYIGIPRANGPMNIAAIKVLENIPGVTISYSLDGLKCKIKNINNINFCSDSTVSIFNYEVRPNALERFKIYTNGFIDNEMKSIVAKLKNPNFNIHKDVILSQVDGFNFKDEIHQSKIKKINYITNDSIDIAYDSKHYDQILFFGDMYNNNWSYYIDSSEEKNNFKPANGIFMYALLPANSNAIKIKFESDIRKFLYFVHNFGIFTLYSFMIFFLLNTLRKKFSLIKFN